MIQTSYIIQHDALLNPRLLYCFQLDVPPPFLPSFMKLGRWSSFHQLKVVSFPIHCKKTLFDISAGIGKNIGFLQKEYFVAVNLLHCISHLMDEVEIQKEKENWRVSIQLRLQCWQLSKVYFQPSNLEHFYKLLQSLQLSILTTSFKFSKQHLWGKSHGIRQQLFCFFSRHNNNVKL